MGQPHAIKGEVGARGGRRGRGYSSAWRFYALGSACRGVRVCIAGGNADMNVKSNVLL